MVRGCLVSNPVSVLHVYYSCYNVGVVRHLRQDFDRSLTDIPRWPFSNTRQWCYLQKWRLVQAYADLDLTIPTRVALDVAICKPSK